MADSENTFPPSKKRAAGREISRDNPGLDDEENAPEQETGTFQRASEEVLATRRIVKVRRNQPSAAASANPFASIQLVPPAVESGVKPNEAKASANPFASIQLVHPVAESGGKPNEVAKTARPVGENPVSEEVNLKDEDKQAEKDCGATEPEGTNQDDKHLEEKNIKELGAEPAEEKSSSLEQATNTDVADEKEATGEVNVEEIKKDNCNNSAAPADATTPVSSFKQLSSSQNAFTGLAGTGSSTSPFSFGTIPKDSFSFSGNLGSSLPPFNSNSTSNGSSSLFGTSGAMATGKSEGSGLPSMKEVPVKTGEENEKAVYAADSVLFEYIDGGWKERGKGELKVNYSTAGDEKARLVMRAKGNYRLILNASLYPDMKLTNMDKKGVTFACINSAGDEKDGLSTFALKFKDGSIVEEFHTVVNLYKGAKTTDSKATDVSKGSDDKMVAH